MLFQMFSSKFVYLPRLIYYETSPWSHILSYFCFSDEHTHTHIYEERPTFGSLVNSYMRAL
jgi:hypothetical protein